MPSRDSAAKPGSHSSPRMVVTHSPVNPATHYCVQPTVAKPAMACARNGSMPRATSFGAGRNDARRLALDGTLPALAVATRALVAAGTSGRRGTFRPRPCDGGRTGPPHYTGTAPVGE